MEVTILMPCLNEAQSVGRCVETAVAFLREHAIDGEVVVADNDSDDASASLAQQAGARVVVEPTRGYGCAIMAGIAASKGRYVIIGDADATYDFSALEPFVRELRSGADVVIGNRFAGGIAPKSMPLLHRYLGNPVLSWLGRIFFGIGCRDFHCGLRAVKRESVRALDLRTEGMEFASELIVKAKLHGQRIVEVPTTLGPDLRPGGSHLRTWRDGFRHMSFLLLLAPRWAFLYPGLVLLALSAVGFVPLVGTARLHTMAYTSAFGMLGLQSMLFWVGTRVFARITGFVPAPTWPTERALLKLFAAGLTVGFGGIGLGIGISAALVLYWRGLSFDSLDPFFGMPIVLIATWFVIAGAQILLLTLFVSVVRTAVRPR